MTVGMYIVRDTEDVHDGVYLCEEACVTVVCVTVRIDVHAVCVTVGMYTGRMFIVCDRGCGWCV